jgi:FRG domain
MAMYLPTKITGEISNVGGVTQIWSDEELAKLTAMGDAVAVGSRAQYRIPQHHAHNLEDAMRIVGSYRKLSGQIGWHCVFRGQTRDYYVSDSLAVLPAIARSKDSIGAFFEPLRTWLGVFTELGIETDAGLRGEYKWHPSLSDQDVRMRYRINHPLVRLRAMPVVAAILQHYGFPTDHLDVSTDPYVSLWFALHATSSDDRGAISFHPVTPPKEVRRRKPPQPTETAEVPALYVYVEPPRSGDDRPDDLHEREPFIDLSRLGKLSAVAQRPTRQSAASLVCSSFSFDSPSPRILPILEVTDIYRWPAAIIKLYFSFEACNRPDITFETLFPKDEHLYRRLLEVKAPYLAVYA